MIDPALIRLAVPARLVTARLELRRDAVEDAPAVLAAVRASHADLAPWLSWITSGYDLAEATRGQRRAIEYWNAGDSFQWRLWSTAGTGGAGATGAARATGAAGAFIGSIDLHTIDWDRHTAELGYWLDSRAAGHGFATEAGRVIAQVAFELLGFARLDLRCHPDNARSLATAHRLGFTVHDRESDGTVDLRRLAAPGHRP